MPDPTPNDQGLHDSGAWPDVELRLAASIERERREELATSNARAVDDPGRDYDEER